MTIEGLELAECQVVVFTPSFHLETTAVLGALLAIKDLKYDGDPIILPPNQPVEAPRIVLRSKDEQHRVQAGPTRLDIFRRAVPGVTRPSISDAILSSIPIIEAYKIATKATFTRLAVVIKRTVQMDQPSSALSHHFCKEQWLAGPLNRPQEFELHAHKVFTIPGSVAVNSWFRCKSAILNLPRDPRAVLVEQDLNTLDESQQEFELPQVQSYLNATIPAFDEILNLYFPPK